VGGNSLGWFDSILRQKRTSRQQDPLSGIQNREKNHTLSFCPETPFAPPVSHFSETHFFVCGGAFAANWVNGSFSPAMVKIIASVAIAFVNDTNLPDTCAILPTPSHHSPHNSLRRTQGRHVIRSRKRRPLVQALLARGHPPPQFSSNCLRPRMLKLSPGRCLIGEVGPIATGGRRAIDCSQ
jgi:hypothetical protein